MKIRHITSLLVLLTIFSLLSSCKKELPYMNDAIITGNDSRTCVCCGGLMITFNGDINAYNGEVKLISTNSVNLGIKESDKFPIYVKVDWKVDVSSVCKRILITRIARR